MRAKAMAKPLAPRIGAGRRAAPTTLATPRSEAGEGAVRAVALIVAAEEVGAAIAGTSGAMAPPPGRLEGRPVAGPAPPLDGPIAAPAKVEALGRAGPSGRPMAPPLVAPMARRGAKAAKRRAPVP